METEELNMGRVHHGRNIRRARIEKNIKQDALGDLVHLSQSAVSKYERSRTIADEILERFARALDVPFEYLKNLEEDAKTVVFENNTVNNTDHGGANMNIGYGEIGADNRVNNFNPIDKISELYERLLKEKDEKYAALENRIRTLEQGSQK